MNRLIFYPDNLNLLNKMWMNVLYVQLRYETFSSEKHPSQRLTLKLDSLSNCTSRGLRDV